MQLATRALGEPYFAEFVEDGWFRRKWRVNVRYHFGPFQPLVYSRQFRDHDEANAWFNSVTMDEIRSLAAAT